MTPPLHPPKSWFEHPGDIPTDRRITITAEGRVYGYIALRDVCHVGMPGCVKPPMESPSNFEFAHQGETMTAEGDIISTANIGGGAGHADMGANVAQAAEFYANTQTQLMRVRYGVDDAGLWFSGALWPDVDELTIEHIRASPISGDWRFLGQWRKSAAGHEFAGAALVNIPGYHMKNAGNVASVSGVPEAIAAAAAAKDAESPSLVEDANGNLLTTYSDTDEPREGAMSCNCQNQPESTEQTDAKCACGQKPADQCDGSCGNVTAEATPVDEAPSDGDAPVEQPKLHNETSNDVLSSLSGSVEEMGTRLANLEDMIIQMYGEKLIAKLEE